MALFNLFRSFILINRNNFYVFIYELTLSVSVALMSPFFTSMDIPDSVCVSSVCSSLCMI